MRFPKGKDFSSTDPFGTRYGNDFVLTHSLRGGIIFPALSALHRKITTRRGILGLVLVPFILIFAYSVQADNALFVPTSCLGGWQYPTNAEGRPDHADGVSVEEFSTVDSSVLPKNHNGSIFCGKFSGDVKEGTQPIRATLRLSWAVRGTPIIAPITAESFSPEAAAQAASLPENIGGEFQIIEAVLDEVPKKEEGVASETQNSQGVQEETMPSVGSAEEIPDESESEDEEISPETTVETPPSTEILPSPEPNEQPTSLRTFFFPKVYAAEETPILAENEEVSEDSASSSIVNLVDDVPKTQSEDGSEVRIEAFPDEPFVEVSVSIDGESWHSLGIFSPKQIGSTHVEIPRSIYGGWEDIVNAQIRIERLLSVSDMPELYLDGMELDVAYENLSDGEETVLGQTPEKVIFNPQGEIIERVVASDGVAVVLTRPANDSSQRYLWLVDLSSHTEAYRFARTEAILTDTPLAIREKVVLWQAHDGMVYGFRLQSRRYLTGEETFTNLDGERRFTLRGIEAEVLLRAGMFTFMDKVRGEVASDDDGALQARFVDLYFTEVEKDREDLIQTNLVPPPDVEVTP